MSKTTFIASEYGSRAELEKEVIRRVGVTVDMKDPLVYEISGTAEQLKALHLDESTSIFGVRVTIQ